MKYAVIKSAGSNKGQIRSIHRYFNSAMDACPATFFTVIKVAANFQVGDYVL